MKTISTEPPIAADKSQIPALGPSTRNEAPSAPGVSHPGHSLTGDVALLRTGVRDRITQMLPDGLTSAGRLLNAWPTGQHTEFRKSCALFTPQRVIASNSDQNGTNPHPTWPLISPTIVWPSTDHGPRTTQQHFALDLPPLLFNFIVCLRR